MSKEWKEGKGEKISNNIKRKYTEEGEKQQQQKRAKYCGRG